MTSSKKDVSESKWQGLFHVYDEVLNAPTLSFAIEGFLQNNSATVIGGLAGHGKTWLQLSIAKALLTGEGAKLGGNFDVMTTADRVVYLVPESAIGPFWYRLKLLHLEEHVKSGRLLVRTLTKGPRPLLSDRRLLVAAKGNFVFLDTLARFSNGDENSSSEFQFLANNIFSLLGAGARSVVVAHHSPKGSARDTAMSLESMLRGTGDNGAEFATAWASDRLPKIKMFCT